MPRIIIEQIPEILQKRLKIQPITSFVDGVEWDINGNNLEGVLIYGRYGNGPEVISYNELIKSLKEQEVTKFVSGNYTAQDEDNTIVYNGTNTADIIVISNVIFDEENKEIRLIVKNPVNIDVAFETSAGTNNGQNLSPGVYLLKYLYHYDGGHINEIYQIN